MLYYQFNETFDYDCQGHLDLESRIARLMSITKETKPASKHHAKDKNSHRSKSKSRHRHDDEESVMDDEELHCLLGI